MKNICKKSRFQFQWPLFILVIGNIFILHTDVLANSDSGNILINEVLINPVGADLGYEWIELFNNSENAVDISEWKLQTGGSIFKDTTVINGIVKIEGQSYLTICEKNVDLDCNIKVDKLGFQNGGGATDGIRLVNKDNVVIDTLLYDNPNTNLLVNDLGYTAKDTETAVNPKEGHTMGRISLIDTNNCLYDFKEFENSSLGSKNEIIDYTGKAWLSEIYFSNNKIDNFVEIYANTASYDFSNWYVKVFENEIKYSIDEKTRSYKIVNHELDLNIHAEINACISLYSPDNKLQDQFCNSQYNNQYSWCRIFKIDEDFNQSEIKFEKCKPTKTFKNELFSPPVFLLKDVLNFSNSLQFGTILSSTFCVTGMIANNVVIEDESAGMAVKCESCEVGKCYAGDFEISKSPNNQSITIQNLHSSNLTVRVPTIPVNQDNLDQFLLRRIKFNTNVYKQDDNYIYVLIGENIIRLNKSQLKLPINLKSEYAFEGILSIYSTDSTGNNKFELINYQISQVSNMNNNLAKSGDNILITILLCYSLINIIIFGSLRVKFFRFIKQ